MDIEQLKLVLEAVSGAGDDVKDVAVWYFITSILKPIITVVGLLGAFLIVGKIILTGLGYRRRLINIALELGIDPVYYDTLDDEKLWIDAIRNLKANQSNK